MMSAATGPPATWRGKVQLGNSWLHTLSGLLLSVCFSETKSVALLQQPSTAVAGLVAITFSRAVAVLVLLLDALTQSMNTPQAVSAGTGLPRHITWLSALPLRCAIRSRRAKWNHW